MMPSSLSDDLHAKALDVTWGLWTEIGVSTWERTLRNSAVDLEALILFTVLVGRFDPRLRDEVYDWCLLNERFIAHSRLRNLIRVHKELGHDGTEGYFEELQELTYTNWPRQLKEIPGFTPSGKSEPPDLSRPSAVQLRYRAVFGTTARA